MTTGSFFTIGASHEVCEDYALAGKDYVIGSDGCSNGDGPRIDTDWGSRILCKTGQSVLHLLDDPKLYGQAVISSALAQCRALGLESTCLTATLLTAQAVKDAFRVLLIGDGFFGGRRKDGTWDINEISYGDPKKRKPSACYYLSYEANPADRETYFGRFGSQGRLISYTGSRSKLEESVIDFDLRECGIYFQRDFPFEVYDLVFIASDGLGSFYEPVVTNTYKGNKGVPPAQVFEILLDFSDTNQTFVERQCTWVFKRKMPNTFISKNWHNNDDVFFGAIHHG